MLGKKFVAKQYVTVYNRKAIYIHLSLYEIFKKMHIIQTHNVCVCVQKSTL